MSLTKIYYLHRLGWIYEKVVLSWLLILPSSNGLLIILNMHFLSALPIVLFHCTGKCSLRSSHLLHLLCGLCRPKGEALRASSYIYLFPKNLLVLIYLFILPVSKYRFSLNSAKEVGGFYKKTSGIKPYT